ncbi:coiled-coil protein [Candidatus Scalindua japonica]|uniref:Coiled-coil protein n=1 Tax=Candidatus Scalindua japonica TaxID=1284222 RepID=A0A286U116_9BACT|nr:hypothetical protein [Candidatus Scalindua japonica]GAX61805.1 coiled-coil protein [Candidatus Scalindua japonica]
MSDIKENIINSIKTLILPELSKLQEGINEIRIRQEALEKQMVMINENVLSNSRRIDEINKRIDAINQRIDDTNKSVNGINQRIDDTNKRLDFVYIEIGEIKKEMERLKREDSVTADILHRMEVLEERVLLKR